MSNTTLDSGSVTPCGSKDSTETDDDKTPAYSAPTPSYSPKTPSYSPSTPAYGPTSPTYIAGDDYVRPDMEVPQKRVSGGILVNAGELAPVVNEAEKDDGVDEASLYMPKPFGFSGLGAISKEALRCQLMEESKLLINAAITAHRDHQLEASNRFTAAAQMALNAAEAAETIAVGGKRKRTTNLPLPLPVPSAAAVVATRLQLEVNRSDEQSAPKRARLL